MQPNRPFADVVGAAGGAIPEDVPDDVRAELDLTPPAVPRPAEPVPEDVLAEQDLEVRKAEEERRQRRVEGRPPAEAEPRG